MQHQYKLPGASATELFWISDLQYLNSFRWFWVWLLSKSLIGCTALLTLMLGRFEAKKIHLEGIRSLCLHERVPSRCPEIKRHGFMTTENLLMKLILRNRRSRPDGSVINLGAERFGH